MPLSCDVETCIWSCNFVMHCVMYVRMCVCVCTYVYVCVCVCVFMLYACVCASVCEHACMCIVKMCSQTGLAKKTVMHHISGEE